MIHRLTLIELAGELRRRSLSPADVIEDSLGRLQHYQPTLNAAILIDAERSLERAAGLLPGAGVLAGVPVPIKDIFDHVGRTTTAGSSFYRHLPNQSSTAVSRLEEAGAVITARLGLHEFAFGFSSENQWFGPVRNPWDPSTSPGGSSGGSAAVVAAGLAPAALGTDTGGSVRVPAALCGLVGLKVTHGRVPLDGVFPLAGSLDTVGPLARTVSDVALVYEVIAGYHPGDPWSVPQPVTKAGQPRLKGLVIGVPRLWITEAPTTEEVSHSFEWALEALASLGAEVQEIDDQVLRPPGMSNESAWGEIAVVHRPWFGTEAYGSETAERLAAAMEVSLDDYVAAKSWQARLRNAAAATFANVDLLVTPSVGALRKTIGVPTISVNGAERPYRTVLSCFSALVNQIGCPAIVLPLSLPKAESARPKKIKVSVN